jgi:hypothetical protein
MFGISQVVPAIRSSEPQLLVAGLPALRVENSRTNGLPVGQSQKRSRCFARRVKRALEKYISFRKTEVMI